MKQTIHRRMGTHISKVKSTSLDIWTKDQVEIMRDIGNIKSNALYNPNPRDNPPPLDLESEHAESAMERFIFKKYRDKAFMEKPQKKKQHSSSSRVDRDASPLPSPPTTRFPDAPAVATIKESGTSNQASNQHKASTPAITRTPAVSVSSPQAAELPASMYASQQPSSHLYAGAAASTTRAMTAPLPDASQRSFSPSVTSNNQGYNPFLRQMTASAQIPNATGVSLQTSSNTGYMSAPAPYQPMNNASYLQSNLYSSSFNPSNPYKTTTLMHQMQPAAPKGEVWNDLAGLSLNGNSSNGMNYQQPLSNTFTGYQPSNMPTMLQTNPFLQSSSMPYKSPSQISSMSSGSSFSSVGSMGSAGVSPQCALQTGYQPSNMPMLQQQPTSVLSGNAQMQMPYATGYQQQSTMLQQPLFQQQPQAYQQFHASNPYANQFSQVQQPYPQYVQGQSQFQGM